MRQKVVEETLLVDKFSCEFMLLYRQYLILFTLCLEKTACWDGFTKERSLFLYG